MLKFYDIDENYVKYLQSIDRQIPNISYDTNNKFNGKYSIIRNSKTNGYRRRIILKTSLIGVFSHLPCSVE